MNTGFKVFIVMLLAVLCIWGCATLFGIGKTTETVDNSKEEAFKVSVSSVFATAKIQMAMDFETDYTKEQKIEDLKLSGIELTGIWYVSDGKIILKNVSDGTYCVKEVSESNQSKMEVTTGC